MKQSFTLTGSTIIFLFSVLKIVNAGDACCKAEAARRALVADPFAVKPANWDDEDDGPWEAPKIPMAHLPAWYRFLRETKLGIEGAAPLLISGVIAAALLTTIIKPLVPSLGSLLGRNRNSEQKGNSILDSLKGSILGLLVPFCSCGALPLAITLKKEGVSSSSIAAFVTAAQAAGIDSLFFTYGVFGARVAILRLVTAGILAFLVGLTLGSKDGNEACQNSKEVTAKNSCCGSDCQEKTKKDDEGSIGFISSVSLFVSTSVELFSSVGLWVFLGVVVSAVAAVWMPPTSATPAHTSADLTKSILSRAGLFLLSLPMTICEHGIVPLADALKGIGFSAGTAVALIVTGPSTNIGTLLLLSRLNSMDSSKSSGSSSNWIIASAKIVSVILVFGVALSYLADDFGSSILIEKAETAYNGDSSLPKWLDKNAVSLAGLFTVASIVQSSSILFR